MKAILKNIILEKDGTASSVRVGMMLCIVIAGYLAIAGLHLKSDLFQLTGLVVVFLGWGVGGKVSQKGKEK